MIDIDRVESAAKEWDARGYETGDLGGDDILVLIAELRAAREVVFFSRMENFDKDCLLGAINEYDRVCGDSNDKR